MAKLLSTLKKLGGKVMDKLNPDGVAARKSASGLRRLMAAAKEQGKSEQFLKSTITDGSWPDNWGEMYDSDSEMRSAQKKLVNRLSTHGDTYQAAKRATTIRSPGKLGQAVRSSGKSQPSVYLGRPSP